jgi:putative transposase
MVFYDPPDNSTGATSVSAGNILNRSPANTNSLNKEIGIMQASYTRAINKQNKSTGSLFRKKTKAICLTEIQGITPSYYNTHAGTIIHLTDPEKDYKKVCFNYIHQNPVESGLVRKPEEWEFSSYRDYNGIREGTLINKKRAKEYGLY